MEEQFTVRLEKLKKLAALGITPYPYRFEVSHRFKEIIATYKDQSADELKEVPDEMRCAGRILAIRSMGKSAFMHLFDGDEKLQIYVRKEMVSEKDFAVNNLLDIGDIIGVKGTDFQDPYPGAVHPGQRIDFSGQVVPSAAGKMARPAGQGTALPPALPGPDRQSGSQGYFPQTFADHPEHPRLFSMTEAISKWKRR